MEVLFVIIIIFVLVAIGVKTNNNIAKKPKNANMPLLRFKAGEWNSEIIKQEVARALKESTLEKL